MLGIHYDFFSKVILYLERSKAIYNIYLEEDKKYFYAKILRDINGDLYGFILENYNSIPFQMLGDFVELITHYEIWINKYDEHKSRMEYKFEDVFVFDNKFIFPKSAENKIRVAWLNSTQRSQT